MVDTRVVLVHGAWADGSSWSRVITALDGYGIAAVAAQLPLSSLADDVAAVRRLAAGAESVLLVGHSYGGAVITAAAAGLDQVHGLVYVSAFVPDTGQSVLDLIQAGPPTPGAAAGRPTDDGRLFFDREQFAALFAADVDDATTRVMTAAQGPIALACLQERMPAAGWHGRPTWYVRSTADLVIAPEAQARMAATAQATVTDVAGSHAALVSCADAVARVVAEAAERGLRDVAVESADGNRSSG